MATNFKAEHGERKCEEKGCVKKTGLTFYVEEKKDLCQGCALKRGCDIAEPKWFCTEHEREEIKLYCKDHNKALCQLCAFTDHNKTCDLKDIRKATSEKKRELESLKCALRSSSELWGKLDRTISQNKATTETHLMSLQDQMNATVDEQIKIENEKKENDQQRINDEADEKIRQINEKRGKRLKQAHDDAEKRRRPIQIKRQRLVVELEDIVNQTRAKFDQMTDGCRKFQQTIEESCQQIEDLLLDDRELLVGTQRLMTLLADIQEKTPDESYAERVVKTVTGVKFEKGTGDTILDGRYINHDRRWELVDSIEIPTQVKNPIIAGCIEEDQVIFSEFYMRYGSYLLNLSNKRISKLLTGDVGEKILMSVTCLDEDKFVCGELTHSFLNMEEGCISVYDRQWRLIRDITLPLRHSMCSSGSVYADVDHDGMIRAAVPDESTIYVIDPTDGKITKTIACQKPIYILGVLSTGDIIAQLRFFDGHLVIRDVIDPTDGKITETIKCKRCNYVRGARSTGDIVTQTDVSDLVIIDGEGQQIRVASSSRGSATVGVDRVTDCLYHLQYDCKRKKCVIDELSSTGDVQDEDVISFPFAPGCGFERNSRVVLTPLGKLIVSDGRNCLVYKRMFNLE